jgi:hypothetical protein
MIRRVAGERAHLVDVEGRCPLEDDDEHVVLPDHRRSEVVEDEALAEGMPVSSWPAIVLAVLSAGPKVPSLHEVVVDV